MLALNWILGIALLSFIIIIALPFHIYALYTMYTNRHTKRFQKRHLNLSLLIVLGHTGLSLINIPLYYLTLTHTITNRFFTITSAFFYCFFWFSLFTLYPTLFWVFRYDVSFVSFAAESKWISYINPQASELSDAESWWIKHRQTLGNSSYLVRRVTLPIFMVLFLIAFTLRLISKRGLNVAARRLDEIQWELIVLGFEYVFSGSIAIVVSVYFHFTTLPFNDVFGISSSMLHHIYTGATFIPMIAITIIVSLLLDQYTNVIPVFVSQVIVVFLNMRSVYLFCIFPNIYWNESLQIAKEINYVGGKVPLGSASVGVATGVNGETFLAPGSTVFTRMHSSSVTTRGKRASSSKRERASSVGSSQRHRSTATSTASSVSAASSDEDDNEENPPAVNKQVTAELSMTGSSRDVLRADKRYQVFKTGLNTMHAINLFMEHLMKEFSHEQLLFLIEVTQFKLHFRSLLNERDVIYLPLDFSKIGEGEMPKSLIVFNEERNHVEKALQLYLKYGKPGAPLEINVSYDTRNETMKLFESMMTLSELTAKEVVNGFDEAIEDVQARLIDSYEAWQLSMTSS